GVHPTMIHGWKKRLLEGAVEVFETRSECKAKDDGKAQEANSTSRLAGSKWNLSGSKKKQTNSAEQLRLLLDRGDRDLSVRRQCELLALPRSTAYYEPVLHVMGIEAAFPGRRTTRPAPGHKTYPYLLRDVEITRPNQVWSTDITYVPLRRGFMYLVA